MAYRIKRKERVGRGIRRILREQLRRAVESARDRGGDQDERVHDVRTRLKRSRAALELIGGYVARRAKQVKKTDRPSEWRPFESLRREVERLFDDFQVGSWRSAFGRTVFDVEPFRPSEIGWGKAPAVDIVDKDKAYEITAELPGLDENNIDVKFADSTLTKGREARRKGGEDEGLLPV